MYLQTLTVMVSELRESQAAVVRLTQKTKASSHQKKLIDSVFPFEGMKMILFCFRKKYLFLFRKAVLCFI